MNTDVVIGLEIHIELNTNSKLFCGCARTGSEEPNTRTCPICLGHPGARPMMNLKALEKALKLCLAVKSKVAPEVVFARKSYFYPDMSKNFQITQYDKPVGERGEIKLRNKKINLTRLHLEEDPASLTHKDNYSLIDYNRSGNPLIELVTEPEMSSPEEAREFVNKLQSILTYLEIHDSTCILKADVNISIKESNYTRVEIKNISGQREIERALRYEITRQRNVVKRGQEIKKETRGWQEAGRTTISLRSKESEEDYGYSAEPDLSVIDVTNLEEIKQTIPELADAKTERFVKQYEIDPLDAEILAADPYLADYFEKTAKNNPKLAAKWIRRELLRVLNYANVEPKDNQIKEEEIIELLEILEAKTITENTAQKIMEELMLKRFSPKQYVEENDLAQIQNDEELTKIIQETIQNNQQAVEDYKNGEEKSLQYIIGQVMKQTKGKADPLTTKNIILQNI